MVISISYMPSNAVSAYISNQVQLVPPRKMIRHRRSSRHCAEHFRPPQTDASQISSASVITQLSVAGQVKSTLADLQDKAVAQEHQQIPNIADFQMIVQGFAQAFNSLNKNIRNWFPNRPAPTIAPARRCTMSARPRLATTRSPRCKNWALRHSQRHTLHQQKSAGQVLSEAPSQTVPRYESCQTRCTGGRQTSFQQHGREANHQQAADAQPQAEPVMHKAARMKRRLPAA